MPKTNKETCIGCGKCMKVCSIDAISMVKYEQDLTDDNTNDRLGIAATIEKGSGKDYYNMHFQQRLSVVRIGLQAFAFR